MKTIFRFSIFLTISLSNVSLFAQFSENFDQNTSNLASNCWQLVQINHTTTNGDVISGTGSAFTNPPTSTSGERSIATPFLNMNSTSLAVSFQYKTSSKITGNATRTITIGISDRDGVFTPLQTLTMDKNTSTSVLTHSASYTLPAAGVYRLELRIGGATGDGNSRIIFDDLNVSASPYYGPTIHCNPAAIAVNDSYSSVGIASYSANVLTNDQFPADNEVYSAFVVTPPATGSLVLNTDGTFTYTPDATFAGGPVTFTYALTDNGYTPATSNTATVTINFPAPVILPVKLLDFKATAMISGVVLKWWVENNYDGDYYEVQSSMDQQHFRTIASVKGSIHSTVYSSIDVAANTHTYYRLRIVNKDGSISYSKIVSAKGSNLRGTVKILGNPAREQLTYSVAATSSLKEKTTVSVYSTTGQQLIRSTLIPATVNTVHIQHLKPGSYILVISIGKSKEAVPFIKS